MYYIKMCLIYSGVVDYDLTFAMAIEQEPSDPPLERTMEEANNSSAIQHDPEITKSDDGKSKSVKGDIGETFEHVIRPEDVHNSLKLDATSGSKSTAEAEGGLANYSEVEIKSDDHK